MYVNVPQDILKLEHHSSSGKDASTMSNHAKQSGGIHNSLRRGRLLAVGRIVASYADVLWLVTRSWGGIRDKPKSVCLGG